MPDTPFRPIRIDVAFLPTLLRHPERTVCAIIDALRATSTLTTLFAREIDRVTAVATIERAFALRDAAVQSGEAPPLLCGEVGGLPPAGFDYGNSPSEFSTMSLAGRRAVLFTSNGTKALVHLAASPAVFAASMLNREAAVEAALAAADTLGLSVTFVCAGTALGTAYCLEDAFCAGALVECALALRKDRAELGDEAETALRLFRSFNGDGTAAFHTAEHGRDLIAIGMEHDLAFCSQADRYPVLLRARPHGGDVLIQRQQT